jgi:hypothetical protein
LNINRPVHGLDLQSIVSDPNAIMYTEAPAMCLPLGLQGTVLPLDEEQSNQPQQQSQSWGQPFPELQISAPLHIVTTAGQIEKLLSACFVFADPLAVKTAVRNLMDSFNPQSQLANGQCARAPALEYHHMSSVVDTTFIGSSFEISQSDQVVENEDAIYAYPLPN